eukprot:3187727-Karenia_brevis.AAC.1
MAIHDARSIPTCRHHVGHTHGDTWYPGLLPGAKEISLPGWKRILKKIRTNRFLTTVRAQQKAVN